MPIEVAVIPVAGLGSRLAPLTLAVPKELLPLGRKPAIQYIVEELVEAGIQRIVFVTSRRKTAIRDHFEACGDQFADVTFEFVDQPQQLGLGHAIDCASTVVDVPFVVALGDSVIGIRPQSNIVRRMIQEFESSSADAVVSFEWVADQFVHRHGIAKTDNPQAEVFVLEDIVEKPRTEDATSNLAVCGRYVFSPGIFHQLARQKAGIGGEIQLTDAIRASIHDGKKVVGVRLRDDEKRFDVGNFERYYRAFLVHALEDQKLESGLQSELNSSISKLGNRERIVATAFARAGLLGNPSDGYGGKTLSVILKNYGATVEIEESDKLVILPTVEDAQNYDSLSQFSKHVGRHGYYGVQRLLKAAVKKFHDYCQHRFKLASRNFSIRCSSNIPRQVGLAGSSAIIVSAMRAMQQFYAVTIAPRVLPSLVLSVERDELGIPAGLQDRVIQCYEGVVFMDFSAGASEEVDHMTVGRYEGLDPSWQPNLYVAYSVNVGEPTEVLHNDLKQRFDAGDQKVHDAMQQFAELAVRGKQAWLEQNSRELSELIDRNFDLRASICNLHADHIAMIDLARQSGASAKYCGSGGAIIGIFDDEAMYQELQSNFKKMDCHLFKPIISA